MEQHCHFGPKLLNRPNMSEIEGSLIAGNTWRSLVPFIEIKRHLKAIDTFLDHPWSHHGFRLAPPGLVLKCLDGLDWELQDTEELGSWLGVAVTFWNYWDVQGLDFRWLQIQFSFLSMDFMISLEATSFNPSQDALSVTVTFTHELWLGLCGVRPGEAIGWLLCSHAAIACDSYEVFFFDHKIHRFCITTVYD